MAAPEDFVARIKADTKDFEKGLSRSNKVLDQQIKSLEKLQDSLKRVTIGYAVLGRVMQQSFTNMSKLTPEMLKVSNTTKQITDNQRNLSTVIVKSGQVTQGFAEQTKSAMDSLGSTAIALNNTIQLLESSFKLLLPAVAAAGLIKFSGVLEKYDNNLSGVTRGIKEAGRSFFDLGKSIHRAFIPGLIGATNDSILLGSALVSLGAFTRDSQDSFVRFIGVLSAVAGVLIGSFGAAVILATGLLGDFLESIGDKLINAMVRYQQEAVKAEAISKQFAFTIKGFVKQLGVDAVGSLDSWNEQINVMVETTTFGAAEIQQAIRLLVSEGARLGLTVEDNQKLLKRSADLAASTGKGLEDVTQRILSGLTGNAAAALALGIDVRESALAHSELTHEMHLSTGQLTDQQKVLLRLAEIFNQTTPIIGAAREELDTVAGSSKFVEKRINEVQVAIGQTGVITTGFIKIQQQLIGALLSLPKGLLEVVGNFIDLFGVIFKTTGAILGLIFPIAAVVNAVRVFNVLIIKSVVTQKLLTKSFQFLATTIGAAIVPVTSLSAVLKNLGTIITRGVLVSFKSLGSGLLSVVGLMKGLLLTLAPIAIKLALIATVVFSVSRAIKELFQELDILKNLLSEAINLFDEVTQSFSDAGEASKDLLSVVSDLASEGFQRLMRILIEVSKIIITLFIGSFTAAAKVVLEFKKLFAESGEEVEKLEGQIASLDSSLGQMTSLVTKSAGGIFDLATGAKTAQASFLGTSDGITEAGKSIKDSFINRMQQAGEAFGLVTPKAEEFRKTLSALRNETLSLQQGVNIIGKDEISRIQLATQAELKKLKIKEEDLEAKKLINSEIRKELTLQAKLISQKGALEIAQKRADVLKGISDENRQLFNQQETMGLSGIDLIKTQLRHQMQAITLKRKELKGQGLLTEAVKEQLDAREKLLKAGAQKAQEQATKAPPLIGDSQLNMITGQFGKAFSDSVAGMSSAISSSFTGPIAAAQGLINVAQGLVDAVPSLLNSFSGLLSSITNLPMAIMDGLLGIFDSITGLIRNFIPNIVNAVTGILVGFGEFIAEGLPKALEDLPDMVINALLNLVDKLPSIAVNLVNGMIRFFFLSIPKLAIGIAKATPVIIKSIIKQIPEIVDEIVVGIAEGLKEVADGILNLFGAGLGNVGKQAGESFKVLGEQLTGASQQLFAVIEGTAATRGTDVADRIRDSISSSTRRGAEFLQKFWDNTFGKLSVSGLQTTLQHFWDNTFGKVSVSGLVTTLETFWKQTFGKLSVSGLQKTLEDFWNKTFGSLSVGGLVTTLETFWGQTFGKVSASGIQTTLEDFWNRTFGKVSSQGIITALEEFWANTFGQLSFDSLQTIWDNTFGKISTSGIETTFQTAWDNSFGKLSLEGLKTTFEDLGKAIWDGLVSLADTVLEPFAKLGKTIWDNLFTSAEGIVTPFIELGGKIIDGLVDGLGNIISHFVNLGMEIWHGVKEGAKEALKINLDIPGGPSLGGGGGTGGFEDAIGVDIPGVSFNKGGIVPVPRFADGGPVGTDTIPALLSPGEFIVSSGAADSIGLDALRQMNATGTIGGTNTNNVIEFQGGAFQISIQANQFDEQFVRGPMMDLIKEELREATTGGENVISEAGVF